MSGRALVLGAGGVTGVAWQLGLLAGLADHGANLANADLLVGTSAGAVVAALVTSGASLAELYAAQLRPPAAGEAKAKLAAMTLQRWARAARYSSSTWASPCASWISPRR